METFQVKEMTQAHRDLYPQFVAASAYISDSCNMFESLRRRAFRHVDWEYQLALPGRPLRSEGTLWCVLSGDCRTCNGQFVELAKTNSLMWKTYCPVECDHKLVIHNIFVEPEGRREVDTAPVLMPDTVKPVSYTHLTLPTKRIV